MKKRQPVLIELHYEDLAAFRGTALRLEILMNDDFEHLPRVKGNCFCADCNTSRYMKDD
ncbi:MAG: hypothetical protein RIG62_14960 [Cyclobacteriaceae bacterium]